MNYRLSWAGPATQPGDVTRPLLTQCAGSRFRPLAVGYLRVWPSDTSEHADTLTAQLRAFARRSSLVPDDVYTERRTCPRPARGRRFARWLRRCAAPTYGTVITPTPEHFSRSGGMYQAMCTTIAGETGADIAMMSECGGSAS